MADDNHVIFEIFRGRDPEERPADIITLCTSMATTMFAHRTGAFYAEPAFDSFQASRFFTELLNLSGKILCPIMDFVKPEEYVVEMRAARLGFRGIADDPDMHATYLHIVRMLEVDNQLENVERAVRGEVWRHFRPQAMLK